eukprot:3731751-Amphidinium_carterae.1
MQIKCRVANVKRALLSVVDMTEKGHTVVLGPRAGFAIHGRTREVVEFERKGRQWQLHMDVIEPGSATTTGAWMVNELAQKEENASEPEKLGQVLSAISKAS